MFSQARNLTTLIIFLSYYATSQTCPNLTFTALQVDCWTDNEIRFSYVFVNDGDEPTILTHGTTPNATIQAWLSSDMILSSNDLPAGGFSIGAATNEPFNPNELWCGGFRTGGGTSSFSVNPNTHPYLILNIDQYDNLDECDETDNTIYARIPDQPCDFFPFFKIFAKKCNECPEFNAIDVGDLEVEISEPVYDVIGNLITPGTVSPPTVSCPGNSRMHYSYDGFQNNSFLILPDYNSLVNCEISARCVCNFDFTEVSPVTVTSITSCDDCPIIEQLDKAESICSQVPLTTQITSWQSDLEATNSLALNDDNTHVEILYSTEEVPSETTVPNGLTATGIHGEVDICQVENQITYAYLWCFGNDGVSGNIDDNYILIGTHTLDVRFPTQEPIIIIQDCMVKVDAHCENDAINFNGDTSDGIITGTSNSLMYTVNPGASEGEIIISITSPPNSCPVYHAIQETPSCPNYELEIADPCSCTNPQNYTLSNAYHFHETVEVTAVTGQTWNMTAVTSGAIYDAAGNPVTLPFAGTETTVGSGVYQWTFWHREVAGFCATYENEIGSTLDNCNACFIPEPSVPRTTIDLGAFSCNDLSMIPACPTNIPELLAGPYSVFWGGSSCEFTVTCVDDAIPLCNVPKQIINRTITLDRGDLQYEANYTYCVESGLNPNVTCDSLGIYVNTSTNKTINPSSLITTTEGFCSSNLSYSSSQSSFDCSDINGTGLNMGIPVLVTVEDDCGNSASCQAKVSVMLEYMNNTFGCSMCGVNSGKDFSRNGIDYYYRIEIIRGSSSEKWKLISTDGSDVYGDNGSLITLPLQGIPVGCGLFLWEYWHTGDDQFSACYQEERTERKVIGY